MALAHRPEPRAAAAGPCGRGFAAHSPSRAPGAAPAPEEEDLGGGTAPLSALSGRVGPAGPALISAVSPAEASPRRRSVGAAGMRVQRCHRRRSFARGHEVSQRSGAVRVVLGELVGRSREGGLARSAWQPWVANRRISRVSLKMPVWNGKLLLLLALGKEAAQRWQVLPSFGCSVRNLVELDECETKRGFCIGIVGLGSRRCRVQGKIIGIYTNLVLLSVYLH